MIHHEGTKGRKGKVTKKRKNKGRKRKYLGQKFIFLLNS
jgi:hypothetical protein